MALKPATFNGLETYKLTNILLTDRELGHGSYASVLELEYMGLKCAGKRIHELLLRLGDTSYALRRFEEECHLLSHVHHPNIVQFQGVYFQQGVQVPTLVMEFLPTNLASCIEQYGILPKEISYTILHDVALGLCYLHNQTSPIVHRDLSSNNILLTPNMIAKISDLGVARILNLTPLKVSRMTQTPGTPAYMPPEVMIADPIYGVSVDEFSYGILMIHMFSGRWPEPQVGPNLVVSGKLIPVTEAERREVFLKDIGRDHPLTDLIYRCIDNDPQTRPHASDIVVQLGAKVLQFPASFANRLEMLRCIKALEEEILALKEEKKTEIHLKEGLITNWKDEAHSRLKEVDQLNIVHSNEVKQLQAQVGDLTTQYQLLKAEKEAELTELTSKVVLHETQLENHARKRIDEREQFDIQLEKEREVNKRLIVENYDLQSEVSKSRSKLCTLQQINSSLEADIAKKRMYIKRKDCEAEAKSKALQDKDAVISSLSEQLTNMRAYLATNQQASSKFVLH